MIYLSQLLLKAASRRVQTDLRDPYEMHRTLCRGFGDGPGELSAARCLFRVEHGGDRVRVLVQSLLPPEWRRLAALPHYLAASPETKAFDPAFAIGQRFAFRLHANPTVKRQGKRLGLSQQKEQYDWLHRKADQSGFVVCSAVAWAPHSIDCQAGEGRSAHFLGVTFEGLLLVTDPARLAHGLAHGIGSGKAFGFGLLSLARAKSRGVEESKSRGVGNGNGREPRVGNRGSRAAAGARMRERGQRARGAQAPARGPYLYVYIWQNSGTSIRV